MRVEREGKRVEVRGDIAGAAWVGIIAPCSPNICRSLDHYKVILATLLESDRYPQPGEACPQNGYPDMGNIRFTVRRPTWISGALVLAKEHLATSSARKKTEHDCILQELNATWADMP
jgi:hypothetical protein